MEINEKTMIKGKTIEEYRKENGCFYYGGCYRKVNPMNGSTGYIYENTGLNDWIILEKEAKHDSFICKVIGIGQKVYNNNKAMTYSLEIINDGYGIDRADWSDDANENNFMKDGTIKIG